MSLRVAPDVRVPSAALKPIPALTPAPTGSQVIAKDPLKHVISLDCKEKVIFLERAFHRLEVARPRDKEISCGESPGTLQTRALRVKHTPSPSKPD